MTYEIAGILIQAQITLWGLLMPIFLATWILKRYIFDA